MKRYISHILCAILTLSGALRPADAFAAGDGKDKNVSYLDVIGFEGREVVKDAREVNLNMNIVLDSTKIRTQHTVSLTPVIISRDGKDTTAFGAVIVDGRTRHKVFIRRDRLDGTDPKRDSALAIIQRKNRKEQTYTYVSSVPYSRWMLDGRIGVLECVKGCADCGEGESDTTFVEQVLPAFIPVWKTTVMQPEPEPIKKREESRIARLQFRWDKYDILPEWQGNDVVLDTVTNSIALVKGKDYISITGIYVAGFASPEGTYEYNMRLSGNRAKSFADYIAEHNGIDRNMITVEWSGEDWAGFRAQLEKSDFAKKDQVIALIDTYTEDRNECERQILKILLRSEYEWLLRNIYPYLRHCTYRIEYEVKNFDLNEARKTIYDRPQDLNLDEIYKVAGSYETGSEEYAYAMAMAAKYYQDSPAVMSDRAVRALDKGNAAEAVKILEKVLEWTRIGQETHPEISAENAELLNIHTPKSRQRMPSCSTYLEWHMPKTESMATQGNVLKLHLRQATPTRSTT